MPFVCWLECILLLIQMETLLSLSVLWGEVCTVEIAFCICTSCMFLWKGLNWLQYGSLDLSHLWSTMLNTLGKSRSMGADVCLPFITRDRSVHQCCWSWFLSSCLGQNLDLAGSRRGAGRQALASTSAFWIAGCCQMQVRNIQKILIPSSILVGLRYAWKTRERRFGPSPMPFESVISHKGKVMIITVPSTRKCTDSVQMILWSFLDVERMHAFEKLFQGFF